MADRPWSVWPDGCERPLNFRLDGQWRRVVGAEEDQKQERRASSPKTSLLALPAGPVPKPAPLLQTKVLRLK